MATVMKSIIDKAERGEGNFVDLLQDTSPQLFFYLVSFIRLAAGLVNFSSSLNVAFNNNAAASQTDADQEAKPVKKFS